jgi:hypothetical protein
VKAVSWKKVTVEEPAWLKQRFGADHYAQISADTTLKLRSSVKDVARVVHGAVPPDVEELTKQFQNAPQGISDSDFVFGYTANDERVAGSIETDAALKTYIQRYPKEWEIVQRLLGISKNKTRHACGFVIANRPVDEFIPLMDIGGVTSTQYTAAAVEAAGAIKMDFLVVNSLNDIQDTLRLVQEETLPGGRASGGDGLIYPQSLTINGRLVPRHRLLPDGNGGFYDIWDLPEDQAVFREISEGKTETVFQFNTPGAVQWLRHFNHWKDEAAGRKAIDSIEAMSAFTALDRPGPLDAYVEGPDGRQHNMLVEYARRARGEEACGSIEQLSVLFPETYGVLTFQEQLQRAYQELTNCTGSEAEEFRTNIAKKKMDKVLKAYPAFIERAGPKVGGEQVAKEIWHTFVTWGQYGFNLSHSVCYSHIAYACAYLKHHSPLQWWCAVLGNASKNEVVDDFWRYCGHLVKLPDVNLSSKKFKIHGDHIRAPVGLIVGVGETAQRQLIALAPFKDIRDFCQKIEDDCVARKVPLLDKSTGQQKATKTGQLRWTKGRSSLTRGVVHLLIAAGVMDSLFAQDLTLPEKISAYEQAFAEVRGEKKIRPVPAKYLVHSKVLNFQLRKKVLPIYSEPLYPLLLEAPQDQWPRKALVHGRKPAFRHMAEDIPVISYKKLQELEAVSPWPADLKIKVAVPCVVKSRRCFSYSKGEKEACELALDCEGGGNVQTVRWPDRKTNKIPALYRTDLEGAIGLALFEKYTERRPFGLTDLVVFHHPATTETDDDPKDDQSNAAATDPASATPTQGQLFPELQGGHAPGADESAA